MKRFGLLCIIFLIPASLFAQITVESVTTDTVDIFSSIDDQSIQRSSGLAIGLSLLVPGLGHQYMGHPSWALSFLSVEALSVVGVVFLERFSRQFDNNSRGYAATHAGVNGQISSERYWQMVGTFASMNAYNETARLAREEDQVYADEKYDWNWNSDESQNQYNTMKDNSRKLHIASSFCIGAMVLNRVLAFVDLRAKTKNQNTVIQRSSLRIEPSIGRPGISLTAEY